MVGNFRRFVHTQEETGMSIYFALIVEGAWGEENRSESFILTHHSSTVEVAKDFGNDAGVRSLYALGQLTDQEQQMLDVLLGIDSATNTHIIENLLVRIFKVGYFSGHKVGSNETYMNE